MFPEPHPSGEALLTRLIQFAEDNEAGLLSGSQTLRLSPRAVEYIAGRLASLDELHRLKSAAPVEFLRGCVSNLGDFKRLERLSFLRRLTRLTVAPFSGNKRDPTPLQLSPFRSLTALELRSCDLVFCAPAGLDALRASLVSLRVSNSLEVLSHLLAPQQNSAHAPPPPISGTTAGGLGAAAAWPSLTSLQCPSNAIAAMDYSLSLLPSLSELDLRRNHITTISALAACTSLTRLNLACNGISDCRPLAECPSLLEVDLSWNGVACLEGLHRLRALLRLDLRGNRVSQLEEVANVGALPVLAELLVQRNPVSCVLGWRIGVLACFPERFHAVALDGEKASRQELRKVSAMVNKHVPLESSHGSHANPQPFPRAQQPSSAAGLQSPSSSYEEQSFGVGVGSPGQNQSQGKSRARVVEFDGQGDTSALEKSRQPASQADAASGGQSNVKGGAWGRHQQDAVRGAGAAGGGGQSGSIRSVPLLRGGSRVGRHHHPPAQQQSAKSQWWEQMQAFLEGQSEEEPSPGGVQAGGKAARGRRSSGSRTGSPPKYRQAVVQRMRASSRTQSLGGEEGEDLDEASDSVSSSSSGEEEALVWRR